MTHISVLGPGDQAILDHVSDDVFDLPVQPHFAAEFLADPHHHLAVALDNELMVGFASAVHCLHPDKPPEHPADPRPLARMRRPV